MKSILKCSQSIFGSVSHSSETQLYLEFGGKLFDDYHASRVLPGFKPDSKLPDAFAA